MVIILLWPNWAFAWMFFLASPVSPWFGAGLASLGVPCVDLGPPGDELSQSVLQMLVEVLLIGELIAGG